MFYIFAIAYSIYSIYWHNIIETWKAHQRNRNREHWSAIELRAVKVLSHAYTILYMSGMANLCRLKSDIRNKSSGRKKLKLLIFTKKYTCKFVGNFREHQRNAHVAALKRDKYRKFPLHTKKIKIQKSPVQKMPPNS